MKHLGGYDSMFETEAWYFWGNIKFLLEHLGLELVNKDPHCDPADANLSGYSE